MTRAFGLTIRKMFIDNKRIFIRFIVSLTVCIALIGVLCSVTAFAADNNASGNAGTTTSISDTASANTSGGTQSADSSVMKDLIGVDEMCIRDRSITVRTILQRKEIYDNTYKAQRGKVYA